MQKRKNDEIYPDDVSKRSKTTALIIIGFLAFIVTTLIFIPDFWTRDLIGVRNIIAFVSGFLIARIVLMLPVLSEKLVSWLVVPCVLFGGFIGIAVGQFFETQLILLPKLAAIRSDANEIFSSVGYLSMIFDPFRNGFMQSYLLFLVVGSVIGIVGLEWLVHLEQGKKKDTL